MTVERLDAGLVGRCEYIRFRSCVYAVFVDGLILAGAAALMVSFGIPWWVILLVVLGYHVLFESSRGQATPGEMAFGLGVRTPSGERLSFWQAVTCNVRKLPALASAAAGWRGRDLDRSFASHLCGEIGVQLVHVGAGKGGAAALAASVGWLVACLFTLWSSRGPDSLDLW